MGEFELLRKLTQTGAGRGSSFGSDSQWHKGGIREMSREGRTDNRDATVGHSEISISCNPWRALENMTNNFHTGLFIHRFLSLIY